MSVQTGLDVLLNERLDLIAGRRIGLVTSPSSIDRDLVGSVERIRQHREVRLVALFGPEHGVRGMAQAGDHVASAVDPITGLPEHSLYGKTRRPTPEMLAGLDALVYDLQDIGVRYYTYLGTLIYVMQAAAEHGLPVIVLDRPNPLNGVTVEGNILDMAHMSFVGIAPLPVRHGLTLGELAHLANDQFAIGCALTIVPMSGWQRSMWFDETGLPFVPPSPNLPTLDAVTLYPGTCLIEGTNLSEGRGTTRPFEYIGAPWLDADALAQDLNRRNLPGVRFRPVHFVPTISKHQGQPCHGIHVYVTDRRALRAVDTGLHLLEAVQRESGDAFTWVEPFHEGGSHFIDLLAGGDGLRQHLDAGRPIVEVCAAWADEARQFEHTRRAYVMYE